LATSVLKSVVGYLGTIEMPAKDGVTGLAAIRNCIRRLRVEKKVHTMVLMCILPDKIVLINHRGLKIAEYPSDRVTFCGMYMDDKRFFGLVTSQLVDDDDDEEDDSANASSCHVFMVEPLTDREEMFRRAKAFQFEPTPAHAQDGEFVEFPADARPIIRVVMSVFGKQVTIL
jgi:regulator of G-protein signaling